MTTAYGNETGFSQFFRSLFERTSTHRTVVSARLPSNLPGASFEATIELTWDNRGTEPREAEAIATGHVCATAAETTAGMSVLDQTSAQHQVNARLAMSQVRGTSVAIVNAIARLAVDAETTKAAEENERYRARLENWRLLRDNVLIDPVMTCVWWLDGHPERLEKLPDMGTAFDRLAALTAANGDRGEDTAQIAHVLRQFIAGLEPEDKQRLIDSVGYVLTSFGRPDLADRLQA